MKYMNNAGRRIAVFYDGSYFNKVSNFYLYQHERKSHIVIKGLHEFITAEVARNEGIDANRCQVLVSCFFRGRLNANQAFEQDKLYSDRVMEDMLIRAEVRMFQQLLSVRADGTFEEKGIDVWLALEAYEMAVLNKYDVCVLVTGDGDFVPLVSKLSELGTKVMLIGWDFSFEKDGRSYRTKVSAGLLDRVDYPVMMNTEIDSRGRRTDPLINGLFTPRSNDVGNNERVASVREVEEYGTLKNLVIEKGYGFITPECSGENIFFHAKSLVDCELNSLNVGDKVSFTRSATHKGLVGTGIKLC